MSVAPQLYLDGDFSKELSYQLWVTKGARFHAARRLQRKQAWSTYTVAALSLYAIGANLLIVYGMSGGKPIESKIAFAGSFLSIAILIVSLIEGSRQYELRADRLHNCAREVNCVYRKVRQARLGPGANPDAVSVRNLAEDYERILEKYENHEEIDYQLQRIKKCEWFDVKWPERQWIRLRWYIEVLLVYHFSIFFPPVLFLWWWVGRVAS